MGRASERVSSLEARITNLATGLLQSRAVHLFQQAEQQPPDFLGMLHQNQYKSVLGEVLSERGVDVHLNSRGSESRSSL